MKFRLRDQREQAVIFFVVAIMVFSGGTLMADEAEQDTKVDTLSVPSQSASELIKNAEQISAKQSDIELLNQRIRELQSKQSSTEQQAAIIADKLSLLEKELAKSNLELKRTKLSIQEVTGQKQNTGDDMERLKKVVGIKKQQLAALIRQLYFYERASPWTTFLSTGSLSEFLEARASIKNAQDQSIVVVQDLRKQQSDLQEKQEQLAQQENDLGLLHSVLAAQESDLSLQRQEQTRVFRAKQDEQSRYEQRLTAALAARREIEQEIFSIKNSGITLTLTAASDMARFASQLTGVRPALLMAVLKVESSLGTNIGSGTFPDDMHPGSREAFLRITKRLGLDPNKAPISRAPSYGWGGAMGPAQIMPATWETIESRLATLLNKPIPDPYNLTDAFVANGVLLADKGANASAGEEEAVGRYLAGPNWKKYSQWYIERVMAVAEEYQKEGLN